MTAEQVRDTVRSYLEAVGSRDGLERFLVEDVTLTVAGVPGPVRGAGAVARAVLHHYAVEFDARAEVVRIVADPRGAGTELLFVGTHVGDYAGIAPTGREVRVPLSMFFDVEDGRITAIRIYYSFEQVLEQLRA
ncbi:MAG TPA: nuclear transport factor 2 family protein [Amnibacterium sp.]|nr:nuclear transport factor 2 family protein [Amnibacterium sp.]